MGEKDWRNLRPKILGKPFYTRNFLVHCLLLPKFYDRPFYTQIFLYTAFSSKFLCWIAFDINFSNYFLYQKFVHCSSGDFLILLPNFYVALHLISNFSNYFLNPMFVHCSSDDFCMHLFHLALNCSHIDAT